MFLCIAVLSFKFVSFENQAMQTMQPFWDSGRGENILCIAVFSSLLCFLKIRQCSQCNPSWTCEKVSKYCCFEFSVLSLQNQAIRTMQPFWDLEKVSMYCCIEFSILSLENQAMQPFWDLEKVSEFLNIAVLSFLWCLQACIVRIALCLILKRHTVSFFYLKTLVFGYLAAS